MTTPQDDDFMTSEETCTRLNVTPRTLERYVKAGHLQRYRRKIGREVFYKRSEVEDLLRIYQVDEKSEE